MITILAAVGVVVAAAAGQPGLGPEAIDRIGRAVVLVMAWEGEEVVGTGSGTLIQPGGLILTNQHVVEGAGEYWVFLLEDPNEPPVPRYFATLVGYSAEVDLALLQIDRDEDGQPVGPGELDLPFLSEEAEGVQRGERVFVFGYPGFADDYLALTEGTITTVRNGTVRGRRMPVAYQTDAEMAPGNSGGIAVNARGEMVGIPTLVRTERGGRLGELLSMTAVNAARAGGLESAEWIPPSPLTAGAGDSGLDYSRDPTFGSATLYAGFREDPHRIEVLSGGEVDASGLGGDCLGYVAVGPDYRFDWRGESAQLRIFFVAAAGGDTTLVVNLPDGSWLCDDDAANTLNPMVVVPEPPPGQYDIWVGSYEADEQLRGTLVLTERGLTPASER